MSRQQATQRATSPSPEPTGATAPTVEDLLGNGWVADLMRAAPPSKAAMAGGGGGEGAWSGVLGSLVDAARQVVDAGGEDLDPAAQFAEGPAATPEADVAVDAPAQASDTLLAQAATAGGGPAPAQDDLGITPSGKAAMGALAAAAAPRAGERPRGKCYNYVMGTGSHAYINKAAKAGNSRWQKLADSIPGSHAMWAVSFAHWLQETSHGRAAAARLGFVIKESDGKTRLGDYLAAHPELKGSVVVIPYGQEGTASREFDAARAYGDKKWGAGVGDISVVTEIGKKGATYVADGGVPHDNATMWWVVYPR